MGVGVGLITEESFCLGRWRRRLSVNVPEGISSGGRVQIVYPFCEEVDYFRVATGKFAPDLATQFKWELREAGKSCRNGSFDSALVVIMLSSKGRYQMRR